MEPYVITAKDRAIAADSHLIHDPETKGPVYRAEERISLIHRLLRLTYDPKQNSNLSVKDIVSEAMGHTWVPFSESLVQWCNAWSLSIAGTDTTATTLSYILYAIATHKDVLLGLRAEIDPLMSDAQVIPDIGVLNKLPYLIALVKECMSAMNKVSQS